MHHRGLRRERDPLDHADDLGEHDHGQDWSTHVPQDSLHQVAAFCHNHTPTNFAAKYLTWADSAGSAFVLITDYASHTPAPPNGVPVRSHLRALASSA